MTLYKSHYIPKLWCSKIFLSSFFVIQCIFPYNAVRTFFKEEKIVDNNTVSELSINKQKDWKEKINNSIGIVVLEGKHV